jgi:hypothetical protein
MQYTTNPTIILKEEQRKRNEAKRNKDLVEMKSPPILINNCVDIEDVRDMFKIKTIEYNQAKSMHTKDKVWFGLNLGEDYLTDLHNNLTQLKDTILMMKKKIPKLFESYDLVANIYEFLFGKQCVVNDFASLLKFMDINSTCERLALNLTNIIEINHDTPEEFIDVYSYDIKNRKRTFQKVSEIKVRTSHIDILMNYEFLSLKRLCLTPPINKRVTKRKNDSVDPPSKTNILLNFILNNTISTTPIIIYSDKWSFKFYKDKHKKFHHSIIQIGASYGNDILISTCYSDEIIGIAETNKWTLLYVNPTKMKEMIKKIEKNKK